VPVFRGCAARFTEAEARIGYQRLLQRRSEGHRRSQEHWAALRRAQEALDTVPQATDVKDIVALTREVVHSKHLVLGLVTAS